MSLDKAVIMDYYKLVLICVKFVVQLSKLPILSETVHQKNQLIVHDLKWKQIYFKDREFDPSGYSNKWMNYPIY